MKQENYPTIKSLNLINTSRGISPSSDCYVDEKDGYAIVIKAGSSISRFGELLIDSNSDWIEKSVYDEYLQRSEELSENRNIVKMEMFYLLLLVMVHLENVVCMIRNFLQLQMDMLQLFE